MAADKKSGNRTIAENRKARHDYFVLESYEAGIELAGTEVKSIRAGVVNLKDCYCRVDNGELKVYGMHISPYNKGNIFNKDPVRERRLLLHKREILKLYNAAKKDGCTVVPLEVYLRDSRVKVEIGLAKGKKLYDKRDDAAKRAAGREMERAMSGRRYDD